MVNQTKKIFPFEDGFDFSSLFGKNKTNKNSAIVFYRIQKINNLGEVTIQFSQNLDWDKMNKTLLNTGHVF